MSRISFKADLKVISTPVEKRFFLHSVYIFNHKYSVFLGFPTLLDYICDMIIKANCKINIGLDVIRKREDGFHELNTVMFPVRGLYDSVEVALSDHLIFEQSGIVVDCPIEKNLCVKALRVMQQRYGVGDVSIKLDKRVPFGAGLGGGSSDATAVIVAINALYNLNLSEQELIDAAAAIGSDTAFFVRNTPQLCSGRGEIMEPIELPLSGLWLAVVKPDNEGVSTSEAYGGIKPCVPHTALQQRLQLPIDQWQGVVKNDFEDHIFKAHPTIATLKQKLINAGVIYASMSGSGSALFGLFTERPNLCFNSQIFTHIEEL